MPRRAETCAGWLGSLAPRLHRLTGHRSCTRNGCVRPIRSSRRTAAHLPLPRLLLLSITSAGASQRQLQQRRSRSFVGTAEQRPSSTAVTARGDDRHRMSRFLQRRAAHGRLSRRHLVSASNHRRHRRDRPVALRRRATGRALDRGAGAIGPACWSGQPRVLIANGTRATAGGREGYDTPADTARRVDCQTCLGRARIKRDGWLRGRAPAP